MKGTNDMAKVVKEAWHCPCEEVSTADMEGNVCCKISYPSGRHSWHSSYEEKRTSII